MSTSSAARRRWERQPPSHPTPGSAVVASILRIAGPHRLSPLARLCSICRARLASLDPGAQSVCQLLAMGLASLRRGDRNGEATVEEYWIT